MLQFFLKKISSLVMTSFWPQCSSPSSQCCDSLSEHCSAKYIDTQMSTLLQNHKPLLCDTVSHGLTKNASCGQYILSSNWKQVWYFSTSDPARTQFLTRVSFESYIPISAWIIAWTPMLYPIKCLNMEEPWKQSVSIYVNFLHVNWEVLQFSSEMSF